MPDVEDRTVVGLDRLAYISVGWRPLGILKFVGEDVTVKEAVDPDASLHQLGQIVAEEVRGDVVVLVGDNVIQDHADGSDLVALKGRVDSVACNVPFSRALTWRAYFCELLVAVEKGIACPKVSLVLWLQELLDGVVVKSKDGNHVLSVKLEARTKKEAVVALALDQIVDDLRLIRVEYTLEDEELPQLKLEEVELVDVLELGVARSTPVLVLHA